MSKSFNRIEISRSALAHNFRVCRDKADGVPVMAMVKADGYGHGMIECACVFAREGAAAFGVAEVREGVALRQVGLDQPVFVLVGLLPETVGTLLRYNLTPVVVDGLILPELSRQAKRSGSEIGLHLKVDAGMGRQGCLLEDVPDLVRKIKGLPGLRLDGIMAHFPMADDLESDNTRRVLSRFTAMIESMAEILPSGCCCHIANSGGLFYYAGSRMKMVRPGIALYGCFPDGGHCLVDGLRPAMRFFTRVIQVRSVPAGTGLGYGRMWTTGRRTILAVLPVGYADGYLRCLSNRSEVLIRGQRFPVVGRISMNLTLVDVTDAERGVMQGDEAVLLGSQGEEEITAQEIAAWMDTISYEALCLFGNLNSRSYID